MSIVSQAIEELKRTDTSFTNKGIFGITPKYKQPEVRDIWLNAISYGMEEGIRLSKVKGQTISLLNGTPKQKEFIEKFYELAKEYNCAIVYHPEEGLTIKDLNR